MSPGTLIDRRRSGFSIIEAIVVLLIAGMVLSLVLPIASRSTSGNLRMGMQGLSNFDESIGEELFRRLVSAAVPPPARPFEAPAADTLSGTSSEVRFYVRSPDGVLCAPRGKLVEVVLQIEATDSGARLDCRSEGREVEVARWHGDAASFSFSGNGLSWADHWPPTDQDRRVERTVTLENLDSMRGQSVVAPLLRLRPTPDSDAMSWIVSVGRAEPVQQRTEDFYRSPEQAIDQDYTP